MRAKFWETGGILFREYCFGSEPNSGSFEKNSLSVRWHSNNRPKGAELGEGHRPTAKKLTELGV